MGVGCVVVLLIFDKECEVDFLKGVVTLLEEKIKETRKSKKWAKKWGC